ncbi:unnamed protein product [Acanthoscelides obtectus]|uniref:Uncharacterized protein n=1 Tax=Acanthoscelides obtectus TaxID=200917 RepID=A0A9P0PRJ2_ACAOB|nr:unnamed protein product [Acanthoscelides obtectus]CAK1632964.1 hypothetical protein AOBTE_LOCUS7848 [Acanthoscelides obtectus]
MDMSSDSHSSDKQSGNPNKLELMLSEFKDKDDDGDSDIIDIDAIHFEDDYTWLCPTTDAPKLVSRGVDDILHGSIEDILNNDSDEHGLCLKNIDTRTFTRPKKRFNRPSLEKYTDEVWDNKCDTQRISECAPVEEDIEGSKPIAFDLTQPAKSHYFDHILSNNASVNIDSFQNMSPPSLVNSMCSSTFANLMESSFINNDPELRKIRDADYTETVFLQDVEPPTFHSMSESCTSINSDTPEGFLKKAALNGTCTFNKNSTQNLSNLADIQIGVTFITESEEVSKNGKGKDSLQNITFAKVENNMDGTYSRTPKKSNTFRKTNLRNTTIVLDATYGKPELQTSNEDLTQTLIKDCTIKSFEGTKTYLNIHNGLSRENTIENMKKELSEAPVADNNRLSYCLDDDNGRVDSGYTEGTSDKNTSMKRQSIGSADSLDRMSSISTSSRESNRMLSVADVGAMVQMQERCLEQVMSTPKAVLAVPRKLLDTCFISPIVTGGEPASDSDGSSIDEYRSVKSSATSLDNYGTPKTTLSHAQSAEPINTKAKANPRSAYTVACPKTVQDGYATWSQESHGNFKDNESDQIKPVPMPKPTNPKAVPSSYKHSGIQIRPASSVSNLKNMAPRLKGSYTSLRPMSANLPVAPPIHTASNHNVAQTVQAHGTSNKVPTIAKVKPVIGDHTFAMPQIPKASGLPRPTGIPRPASRIPGPRVSGIRVAKNL